MLDKKTIVTGGDSGIGRAAAVMYAMEGADVAIVYLPEEQVDAEKTKELIERAGRQCLLFPQDIRDEQGCKRVIDSVVQAWGRIDVLVNNASVMVSTRSHHHPLGMWHLHRHLPSSPPPHPLSSYLC